MPEILRYRLHSSEHRLAIDSEGEFVLWSAVETLLKSVDQRHREVRNTISAELETTLDRKPDCNPGDHEIVPESGQYVHCAKCQRSGRKMNGMIRWSD